MKHYFSRTNKIENIQQFCELLNNVISLKSTEAMGSLFSIDKSKDENIAQYLTKDNERVKLNNVLVFKPISFKLRRKRRIRRLLVKKSKK